MKIRGKNLLNNITLVLIICSISYSEVVILEPSQDAAVYQIFPTLNTDGDNLTIGYSTDNDWESRVETYIKFDISVIPSGSVIETAILKLYCYDVSNWENVGSYVWTNAYKVNNSWNESIITWANKPNYSSINQTEEFNCDQCWWNYDWNPMGEISMFVQEWVNGTSPNYGLMIDADESNGAFLAFIRSREYYLSAYRPELVVVYSTPTPACEDPNACNYGQPDDCWYPNNNGWCDCDGNVYDDCGVCGGNNSCYGCTSPQACNYDPNATIDDGSCYFPQGCNNWCNGDPGGPLQLTIYFQDTDGDGFGFGTGVYYCPNSVPAGWVINNTDNCPDIYNPNQLDGDNNNIGDACQTGCTDPNAINYDPFAGLPCDGNNVCCEYDVLGCTDNSACNFDPNATVEDGSCIYTETYYPDEDEDGFGAGEGGSYCPEDVPSGWVSNNDDNCPDIYNPNQLDGDNNNIGDACQTGCTDPNAINYDPFAGLPCGGNNVCCEYDVLGCTDNSACNFDPDATVEDGSCIYTETYYPDEDEDGYGAGEGGSYCPEDVPSGWVSNNDDNCPDIYNPNQLDGDNNNIGDACQTGCTDPNAINYDPFAGLPCEDDNSCCEYDIALELFFGDVFFPDSTIEILITNFVDIAGFQFVISDQLNQVSITDAFGGLASEYDFTVSSSQVNNTIIGFSVQGEVIPLGFQNEVLTILKFNEFYDTELCITDEVFTDINGSFLYTQIGPCVTLECVLGDINNDNNVDVLDIVKIVNVILGEFNPNEWETCASDINSDSNINVQDVIIIIQLIIGDILIKGSPNDNIGIIWGNNNVKVNSYLNPSGIQLSVTGDFEITQSYLPSGWQIHSNGNTILMFSMDGSPLESETLFEFSGELNIESALVADWQGNGIYADIHMIPEEFSISEPYPNPFNPVTTFDYTLPVDSDINVVVYDIIGREVATLINQYQSAGRYTISWDAMAQPSGIYFVVLRADNSSGGYIERKKIVLMK